VFGNPVVDEPHSKDREVTSSHHADSPAFETRVLLLRHAETAAPDQFHGAESDIGLSERGRRQAEAVAQLLAALRPRGLYSSEMRRAVETTAPVARATGLEPTYVAELHERRMGSMSGMNRQTGWPIYDDTKSRWMAGDLDHTHPGGESFRELRERVVPAFLNIVGSHRDECIVVVAHGIVIRALITSLVEGLGPADFDAVGIEFVAVNDLRWDGRIWRANSVLSTESET
jgi:2,3-bisphosphoglycerate-dependent phosphoglycerate mutase